jgi:site-specific recombinase XerD
VYGKINPIIICNVSQSDIYNYLAYMDNVSKNTRKIRIYAIKNFYSYLKIRQDLFEDIKLYGSNKKTPYFLSSLQCKRLIDYYKDKRNRLIIYLFLTTGIRLSELSEIRIEDIENNKIKIMCKGRVERWVYLNKNCSEMIQKYVVNRKGKLFNISKVTIQYIVKKAMRDLGLNGSVHTLRHTFATMMYQETHDIRLVQELLGHKSIMSTQIYTHFDDEIKNAVERNPLNEN